MCFGIMFRLARPKRYTKKYTDKCVDTRTNELTNGMTLTYIQIASYLKVKVKVKVIWLFDWPMVKACLCENLSLLAVFLTKI